ncbi:hypothetical protein QR680_016207 [Steinernema hermaphroditum]|uniref:Uncharacterized protein n=1 Tax=Steinernema hermaphroditum TaxID=289476 RepID=A0AA39LLK6_9BILA|nr:hypothetical protein QR680_016207 [Steinernema hermaphroditum]
MAPAAPYKAQITKHEKKSEEFIARMEEILQDDLSFPREDSELDNYLTEQGRRLSDADVRRLETAAQGMKDKLAKLEAISEQAEDESIESYTETALDFIMRVEELVADAKWHIDQVKQRREELETGRQQLNATIRVSPTPERDDRIRVEPLKIPSFSGEVFEWFNFVQAFETLIHNKPLANWEKYAHLMKAVTGDAKVFLAKYVNPDNYEEAFAQLKRRYGDVDMLALKLNDKLNQLRKPTDKVSDQRRFVDECQLKGLGIDVNSINTARSIMRKLPASTYDKVLDKIPKGQFGKIGVVIEVTND